MSEPTIPTVTHRELRNQSGDILRRAQAGETLVVTSHGKPVAVLGPADTFTESRLTPARSSGPFTALPRAKGKQAVLDVLDDQRSER